MKIINFTALLCLGVAALAQDVHYDYDRAANFGAYKTYEWVAPGANQAPNQLIDQDIKRAVDEQLAAKGLRRVEQGGDLKVAYQAAIDREAQINFSGFRDWGGFPGFGGDVFGQASTSRIDIGTLSIELFDQAKSQLVWRGDAKKTLDVKKDPDKNYRNLQKAMAKLFKNYPPGYRQQ